MKVFMFFMLVAAIHLSANSYSQNTKISLDMNNVTIKQVLQEIENQTEFRFLYSDTKIDVEQKVNVNIENSSIQEIFKTVFDEAGIIYEIRNRQILLSNANPVVALQNIKVTGKVTDSTGNPLPGVTVVVKGTTNGTISNFDGVYTLPDVPSNGIIQFSFVGMKMQEIAVAGQSSINVVMEESAIGIEEVVAVGYGTMKKSDLTGSVASVKANDIKKSVGASFDAALAGRAAGVHVTQSSGEPGGQVSITIRGKGTILGGNEPLYVIDGFPIYSDDNAASPGSENEFRGFSSNALASLNPGDIESVEILKDASATSIYGARGANGVILITTRKGNVGRMKVSFESYGGFQKVSKTLEMMNAEEYAKFYNEYRKTNSPNPNEYEPIYPNPESLGEGTNWQEAIFRTGIIQNYQLSLSGGNNKTTYSITGNYYNNEGIIQGSGVWRGYLRTNFHTELFRNFNFTLNLTNSRNVTERSVSGWNSPLQQALRFSPIVPIFNEDGSYGTEPVIEGKDPSYANPYANAKEILDQTVYDRTFGDISFSYRLFKNFTLRSNIGINLSSGLRDQYKPTFASADNGAASINNSTNKSFINENTLTFDKTYGEHHIIALGGFSQQQGFYRWYQVATSNYTTDYFKTNNLSAGTTIAVPGSSASGWALKSFFSRVNYSYKEKYLVTLTARADGSSKFGRNSRWGYFPSVGVAYRIGEEDFIKNIALVEMLKLRASYGITGNSEIPAYSDLAHISTMTATFNNNFESGMGPSNIANPDLKWETTEQFDVGLDLGVLKNRITVNADYYYKNTSDLLLNLRTPSQVGYTSVVRNIGELENKGFELSINAKIFDSDFKWSIGGNISTNKTKVLSLGGMDKFRTMSTALYGSWTIQAGMVKVGEPLGVFWGYVADGIFADQNEIDSHITNVNGEDIVIQPSVQPGDVRYLDINKDGILNTDDETKIGDANPDYIWGLNQSFSYKNFDLSMQLSGVHGNEICNITALEKLGMGPHSNLFKKANNFWTEDNRYTDIPRPGSSNALFSYLSTRHIEDGSFVRLQNVTFSYTFAKTHFLPFEQARVYVSGQNLLVITNYSGYDPEVSVFGKDPLNSGYDLASYPKSRTFILGVSVTF